MASPVKENLSDGSFDGFDDDNAMKLDDEAPKRKTAVLDEKDSDEEELERLVLGGRDRFREALFRDDFFSDAQALVLAEDEEDAAGGQEGLEDSALFTFDTGLAGDKPTVTKEPGAKSLEEEDAPAWEDSDDERLTISLADHAQRRKLRVTEGEDLVNGTEFARRSRQLYLRLCPTPEWAKEKKGKDSRRRRRSSASQASLSDSDSEDEEIDSALPLERFLRDVNSFNGDGSRKRRKLRTEVINIQRTRDIPDQHKVGISTLAFHPQYPILLSTSKSSLIYLHHFAPTAHPTPNPMLTSIQARGTPIRHAEFLHPNGDEIVFAGRRKYYHSWNLNTGLVKKVTRIQGHRKEHKTMERFRLSPCGRYMASIASDRKGGGMLNIISVNTMQWIAQARIDGRGGIADFSWWRTGDGITILGVNGEVAEWSMSTKRTVGTWQDAGNIGGTVMALGGSDGPSELGGDRWVALGSTSGILTIYDRSELCTRSASGELNIKPLPEPRRSFEQLTTSITFVTFTKDGQLMTFGSAHKKDALRLVHLPSCTVYKNWPTAQTPLGRISAVAFSADSDVLAVGNDVGKIHMWEIRA